MTLPTARTRLVLSSYTAKTCARRISNEFDRTMPRAPETDETSWLAQRGIDHEARIVAELVAANPDAVDLNPLDHGDKEAHVRATMQALADGRDIVIGGRLADDETGGRSSKPDLLLRGSDQPDGRPGYHPVDIKSHKALRPLKKGTLRYSTIDAPSYVDALTQAGFAALQRDDDSLQLAHYQTHLETLGCAAPGPRTAAILGTTSPDGGLPVLVWQDLDDPVFHTFSRSNGTAWRSAMERYDHEFGFRYRVAANAIQRTGAADDPEPLVDPVITKECDSCPWFDTCTSLLDPDDPSRQLTGRLDVREWDALRTLGITTIGQLAALDQTGLAGDTEPVEPATAALLAGYLPEVTHRGDKAQPALALAVQRARMVRDGTPLLRTTTGPVGIPRADVEVDLDLEWDANERVYLWGLLVDDGIGDPTYTSFAEWQPLDAPGEAELAGRALAWLLDLRDTTLAAGRTLLVYHYTSPEILRPRRIVSGGAHPSLPAAEQLEDLLADHFVDLYPIVKQHYIGLHGLGLKHVATTLGFAWRDDDPGGLQSMNWFAEAVESNRARTRLLAYNEDDTRATATIRRIPPAARPR